MYPSADLRPRDVSHRDVLRSEVEHYLAARYGVTLH
jgi:hypothetical protein